MAVRSRQTVPENLHQVMDLEKMIHPDRDLGQLDLGSIQGLDPHRNQNQNPFLDDAVVLNLDYPKVGFYVTPRHLHHLSHQDAQDLLLHWLLQNPVLAAVWLKTVQLYMKHRWTEVYLNDPFA